ncbi:MAG TPA: hypothetical protein VGI70_07270, partial [Polyangiales bacterium]
EHAVEKQATHPIEAAKAAPAATHHAEAPPPSAAETKAPQPAAGPYVIDFVTRPSGATINIGERSVVAPGQLELGNEIPDRMKVIAKKDGFQQSSAWIDRAGFESVDGKMWRRVYMTLPVEPPPAAATAQPH